MLISKAVHSFKLFGSKLMYHMDSFEMQIQANYFLNYHQILHVN